MKEIPLVLEPVGLHSICWWVDASFGVHPNLRSHTGTTLSFGKRSPFAVSCKQKLNTCSSTEAKLVGLNDVMSLILWTRRFMEAQGYVIRDNVILQDNQSTMLLARSGQQSSGKATRNIDVRYYFVKDQINKKLMRLVYCPTDLMVTDMLTNADQAFVRYPISPLAGPIAQLCRPCVDVGSTGVCSGTWTWSPFQPRG